MPDLSESLLTPDFISTISFSLDLPIRLPRLDKSLQTVLISS